MEGGGKGRNSRSALRLGMDAFLRELKEAARRARWHWKLVCCGSRKEAFRAFTNARKNDGNATIVLLVDAEGSVRGSPVDHLRTRDEWEVSRADQDIIHLMTQVMETWIIADSGALGNYYGQGFKGNALPKASDLETVTKADIGRALELATKDTRKGRYHKIRHASDLLACIDSERVQQRCTYCKRLFALIGKAIAAG